MPTEEFSKTVDTILNHEFDLKGAITDTQMRAERIKIRAKQFIQITDKDQAEALTPEAPSLMRYTRYLSAEPAADGYKEIIDSIIASKPESGIRLLSRLEEAANREAEAFDMLVNTYSKHINGENAPPLKAEELLAHPQLTQEERNNLEMQETIMSNLRSEYTHMKADLILEVSLARKGVRFTQEHMDSAIEAVSRTILPAPAVEAPEMPDIMRQTLEEFKNDKTPPSKSGNGPRSTPAVEGPAAPERSGR